MNGPATGIFVLIAAVVAGTVTARRADPSWRKTARASAWGFFATWLVLIVGHYIGTEML